MMNVNERGVQAVNDPETIPYRAAGIDVQEVRGKSLFSAFILGMAFIAASLFLGRSYVFFISFIAFSLFMTLLWRKAPLPWIFLVSISAATPLAVSRYQFACNIIFALWLAVFNSRDLFRLPKWFYVPAVMAVLGIFTSSINWMSEDVARGVMRQATYVFNIFLAPFLLLPLVYLRLSESRDNQAKLQGLLFYLIVPSTLLLISAKLFGTVVNEWEASLHTASLAEGFLVYQLGKALISFLRTEVGFILAALVCASAAVAVSQVKGVYRLVAGICLVSNAFLLLVTGSFGSGFACFCGLSAIFFAQFRKVSAGRALVSGIVIALVLILTYSFSPTSTKEYLAKRYEHRVVKADKDRIALWGRAVDQLFRHPEGVGMTMSVGDKIRTFIHNDYLTYAVSYGVIGGLGYAYLVVGLLIAFFRMRKGLIDDPSMLAVYLAGLGVLVAIAVNSMTDHMNANRWYFNVMWSIIWYSYFCCRATQTESDPMNSGLEPILWEDHK